MGCYFAFLPSFFASIPTPSVHPNLNGMILLTKPQRSCKMCRQEKKSAWAAELNSRELNGFQLVGLISCKQTLKALNTRSGWWLQAVILTGLMGHCSLEHRENERGRHVKSITDCEKYPQKSRFLSTESKYHQWTAHCREGMNNYPLFFSAFLLLSKRVPRVGCGYPTRQCLVMGGSTYRWIWFKIGYPQNVMTSLEELDVRHDIKEMFMINTQKETIIHANNDSLHQEFEGSTSIY